MPVGHTHVYIHLCVLRIDKETIFVSSSSFSFFYKYFTKSKILQIRIFGFPLNDRACSVKHVYSAHSFTTLEALRLATLDISLSHFVSLYQYICSFKR